MTNPNLKAQYLLKALQNFQRTAELPITLAVVKAVSEEGYFVDIEHSVKEIGAEVLKDIPVIHSKYVNTPILEGDLVILIPFSHLIQNYLEDKSYGTEIQYAQCYFALPMCYKEGYKHKNELSIRTPDEKFIITFSDDNGFLLETQEGLKIKFDTKDLTAELNQLAITANTKVAIESKAELALKASSPIEIGTNVATLGAILQDICNAVISLASATAGPTTPASPTLAADVAQIITKISGSFKQ